jgi:hypothetical protein
MEALLEAEKLMETLMDRLAINISLKTGTFYKILKEFRFYIGFD